MMGKRWLRHELTLASRLRFTFWRLFHSRGPIVLRLREGPRFELEPGSADATAAYEVWVQKLYELPAVLRAVPIRSILDLGSQSGHSVLFWSLRFPTAEIIAVEPHPVHVAALRRNLELNGLTSRVKVLAVAAGTDARSAILSDAGTSSSLIGSPGSALAPGAIPIEVIDLFENIRSIDLVKMDIEGSEYELLGDPRFTALGAKLVVLEVHPHPEHHNSTEWCEAQLRHLGYTIVAGSPPQHIWACAHSVGESLGIATMF